MIRFVKILLLILFSCFLTTGSIFAHIQSTKEKVSCCESPSETKNCCEKKATDRTNSCKEDSCCSKFMNTVVLFSEIGQEFNLHTSTLNVKNQTSTFVQLHLKNQYFAVWQPPKISLNL